MSVPPNNNLFYRLKKQHYELSQDVASLKNGNSAIYTKYEKNIEKTQNIKMEKLQEWYKNEKDAAYKERDCDKYAADCDEAQQILEQNKKLADYIYYKADKIYSEFPEAAAYFESQGYNFNFDKVKKHKTNSATPKIAVLESNHQLIDSSAIEEDLEALTLRDNDIPECFQNSEKVKIKIGDFPELIGTVSNVTEDTADFTCEGNTIQLDMNAIRFGHIVYSRA